MFFVKFLLTMTVTIALTFANSDITELMRAIKSKNTNKVKELVQTVDIINTRDKFGWNVLHVAAFDSNGEITRLLLSHGADADSVLNEKLRWPVGNTYTPLMFACSVASQNCHSRRNAYQILEALLRAGARPNIPDLFRNSPLHVVKSACEARLLISYGADVDAQNLDGFTPAHMCAVNKYRDVLYALIDGKANFTITTNLGNTIFHVIFGLYGTDIWSKDLVLSLARNGAPLETLNNAGESALTQFLKLELDVHTRSEKYPDIRYENLNDSFYAYMFEAGANVNASNGMGETMLHISVCGYQRGLTKWLLERGANMEVRNSSGDTPLLALLKQEKWNRDDDRKVYYNLPPVEEVAEIRAVINVLVEAGANIGALDQEGRNAVHYANETKLTSVDPFIVNSLKQSPY